MPSVQTRQVELIMSRYVHAWSSVGVLARPLADGFAPFG